MTINHKFLISFCLLLVPLISLCQTLSGKVVRVSDGDTITILDTTKTQTRVRLYGIDCPEIGQDFGQSAKKYVSDLIAGEIVYIEIKDIDRYGRTVGIVWTGDSLNVNLDLLKAGLAWHYKYFDKSEEFAQAEHVAKVNKIGLWKQPNAIAPWDFRRNKKTK